MSALALFALGNLKHDITAVITWLSHRSFWQLVCLGLAIFAVVQTIRVHAEQRHSAKVEQQLSKTVAARKADREAYEKAQAAAKAKNLQTIAQVKSEQEKITNEVKSDLGARLERLRRELRDNPAAKGSAGRTPIPETGPAPCRAYDPAWLCLSPADRLRAAENEQRHDSLIDWIERQSKVDPNK